MLQMMNKFRLYACYFIFLSAVYNDRLIKNFQLNSLFQSVFWPILLFCKKGSAL